MQILIIPLFALIVAAQNNDSSINLNTKFLRKIIDYAIHNSQIDDITIDRRDEDSGDDDDDDDDGDGGDDDYDNTDETELHSLDNRNLYDPYSEDFNLDFNIKDNGYLLSIKQLKIVIFIIDNYNFYDNNYILLDIDILLSYNENGQLQITKDKIELYFHQIKYSHKNPINEEIKSNVNSLIDDYFETINNYKIYPYNPIQFNNIPISFNLYFNKIIQITDKVSQDFTFLLNTNTLQAITKSIFDAQQFNGIIDNPNFPSQIQKAMVGYNNFKIKIRFDQVPNFHITNERIIAIADNVVAEIFAGNIRIHKLIMGLKFVFQPSIVKNTSIKLELREGGVVQFNTQKSEIKSIDKTIMRNFINTQIINQIPKINEFLFNNTYIPFNFFGLRLKESSFNLIENNIQIESYLNI